MVIVVVAAVGIRGCTEFPVETESVQGINFGLRHDSIVEVAIRKCLATAALFADPVVKRFVAGFANVRVSVFHNVCLEFVQ